MATYIEREAVLEAFKSVTGDCTCPLHISAEIDQILGEAPAADVVTVVHGRWIPDGHTVCCSECKTMGSPQWKGCPVCLARMDG